MIYIDEGAYTEGGTWFVDRWLPAYSMNNNNTKGIKHSIVNFILQSKSIVKTKMFAKKQTTKCFKFTEFLTTFPTSLNSAK